MSRLAIPIVLAAMLLAPPAVAADPVARPTDPTTWMEARTLHLEPLDEGGWQVLDADGYRYDPVAFARAVRDSEALASLLEERRLAERRRDVLRGVGAGLLGGAGVAAIVGLASQGAARASLPDRPDLDDYETAAGVTRWSAFQLADNAWWEEHNTIMKSGSTGLAVGLGVAGALAATGIVLELAAGADWQASLTLQADPTRHWSRQEAEELVEAHNDRLRDELTARQPPPLRLRLVLGPGSFGFSARF